MSDRMNDLGSATDSEEDEGDIADKNMTTTYRHYLGDESDRPSSIRIVENIREDYGLFVWLCSFIPAEYVWQQRFRFSGANVVEMGAGTSLPGLVAAKVCSNVTLTNDSDRAWVLENMKRVCELNNPKCKEEEKKKEKKVGLWVVSG